MEDLLEYSPWTALGLGPEFVLLLFATPLLPYSPTLNCPVSLVVDENAKPVGYLADGRFEADVIKKIQDRCRGYQEGHGQGHRQGQGGEGPGAEEGGRL